MTVEEKKEYMRNWRAKNPNKAREDSLRWRANNPGKVIEGNRNLRKTYAENPEKEKERCRNWRILNPDKMRACKQNWRIKNPDKVKDSNIKWQAENPEKVRESKKRIGGSHFGRAVKRGNHAERFKRADIFERDGYKCAYCKKKVTINTAVLEHRIPIAKGGSHTPENCTTSCAKCNAEKAAKLVNGMQITIFDKVKP